MSWFILKFSSYKIFDFPSSIISLSYYMVVYLTIFNKKEIYKALETNYFTLDRYNIFCLRRLNQNFQ